jgi:5-methylcytosine-specific restriction endonuclease McrA
VSPDLARTFLDTHDCFVKLVLHDGVRITDVKHEGRKRSAELRTAVSLGDPPLLHGPECGCGCAKRKGLQVDHVNPVANGGETSLDNLDTKCTPSHKAKTERDRAAGLLDGRAPPDRLAG